MNIIKMNKNKKLNTCDSCKFFNTLGHTQGKRVCLLKLNHVSSVSPACKIYQKKTKKS